MALAVDLRHLAHRPLRPAHARRVLLDELLRARLFHGRSAAAEMEVERRSAGEQRVECREGLVEAALNAEAPRIEDRQARGIEVFPRGPELCSVDVIRDVFEAVGGLVVERAEPVDEVRVDAHARR